jgi:hypothetical protein
VKYSRYRFVGTRPSGVYTVRVGPSDHLGNSASTDGDTIVLDDHAQQRRLHRHSDDHDRRRGLFMVPGSA